MKFTEKQLKSQNIYDGRILKAFVDDVELPDGSTSVREYVRHSGGAAALFIEDGKVALVKQFRYVYGKEIYEIPAGKVESDEDPSSAAIRELEEETGYMAKDFCHFLDVYPSPGYTDKLNKIYLVKRAARADQKLDEGEFLSFEFIPLEDVVKMIEDGEICDAKTVAAIFKYLSIK
ncbi:MAG: NUDIX hydrolase [Clostridia bacterium]|nr:NUDIX hydrolase [Clostridia bacterium]